MFGGRLLNHNAVQRNVRQVTAASWSTLSSSTCRVHPQHDLTLSVAPPFIRHFSQAAKDVLPAEPDKLYSTVEVECRGNEPAVLQSYLTFVSAAAGHLDVNLQEVEWPKKHIKRWTLLKSVHIYKKHRVQYEVRTHFLILRFSKLTGSTADTFLEYIQRNLPEGISMRVTKHELENLPEYVTPSSEVIS